jgi:hypothetical protein
VSADAALDDSRARCLLTDVGVDEIHEVSTKSADELLALAAVDVGDDDPSALRDERLGCARADPLRPPAMMQALPSKRLIARPPRGHRTVAGSSCIVHDVCPFGQPF